MRKLSSLLTTIVLSFFTITAVGCATIGDDDDLAETEDEAAGAGKLSFWQAGDGWRFNLKSGNGAVLLTSEAYTSRTGAITGALSVLDNGVDKAQYTTHKTETGYNLYLKAGNNETIAFSQVYSTKSNATRAITSSVKAVTSYLDKREANTTGARVDVLVGDSGKWRFNVFAKNGQIVLSSEQYTTPEAAFNGAFAVQAEGQTAANYTVMTNSAGGFYFTLSALNGQVVGVSQQYTSKTAASSAITSLKSFLPTVSVL